MTLIIVTGHPPLSMLVMTCMMMLLLMRMIISSSTLIDVPTASVGIAFDERLEKHPHPCRKCRHTSNEIGL